ncbi:hypothetical protein V1509DRAFT_632094 [Lipomyces kononenkoae]
MRNILTEFFEAIVPAVKAEEPEEDEVSVSEDGPSADEEAVEEAESETEVEEEDEEVEEEEEEEEEEPEDIFPKIQERCANSSLCHDLKHHYDECVERVTKAQEEPGYEDLEHKEDCIEEL